MREHERTDPEDNSRQVPADPADSPHEMSATRPLFLKLSRLIRPIAGRWIALSGIIIPSVLALLFLLLWLVRHDPLQGQVILMTGSAGGSYDVFGTELSDAIISNRRRLRVRTVHSTGSGENVVMIESGSAHLGMYQGGTVDLHSAAVVAPLYREVVHVLVRKDALEKAKYEGRAPDGDLLRDLLVVDGHELYAGSDSSGMRCSAKEILGHYGIHPGEVRFIESTDASTPVIISTTGMFSLAMRKRLRGGHWRYLTLDANAIAGRHAHFSVHTIYRGSYRDKDSRPVPEEDVSTVATTAFLIAHRDAPPGPVKAVLDALYQGDLGRKYPDLIRREDANAYLHGIRLHGAAREYYDPYDYGPVSEAIESLAATKELIVALGACAYVLWTLRRRRQERQRTAVAEAYRLRLDQFVDRTVAIESAQIGETDPVRLSKHLEEVTRIKLQALDELTDEELRGDRVFSIFLMQCANLISKLQLKIIAGAAGPGKDEPFDASQQTVS